MALVTKSLETTLYAAFKAAQQDQSEDQDTALRKLCSNLATAIDAYIRTATVISTGASPAGPVTTTSTAIT